MFETLERRGEPSAELERMMLAPGGRG